MLPVAKVGTPIRSWSQCAKSSWTSDANDGGVAKATVFDHAAEAAEDADAGDACDAACVVAEHAAFLTRVWQPAAAVTGNHGASLCQLTYPADHLVMTMRIDVVSNQRMSLAKYFYQ